MSGIHDMSEVNNTLIVWWEAGGTPG